MNCEPIQAKPAVTNEKGRKTRAVTMVTIIQGQLSVPFYCTIIVCFVGSRVIVDDLMERSKTMLHKPTI